MTVTAQAILTRVRTQLIDDLPTKRWSDDELLGWLSDGERTIVASDPSLGSLTTPFELVLGTKQIVPDGAFMLLDITRNLYDDGSPGRVITVTSRENLDRVNPDWHHSARSDTTQHYTFDPKTPRMFYVYPPSVGGVEIEIAAAYTPPEITDPAQLITVPDLYQTALFDFVMFRAHQKDSDYAAGDQKAQGYLQLFQMFFAATQSGLLGESPNKQLGQPDLTDKGAAA